ncbi:uncharacterized protein LOC126749458 [Anthonomus grandis grandis]|uniref:uncharacterized protein LOC126749458 n=1 Tax=Anthonomus grandis grandis TaxID=2921223 RepID=UPI0021659A54|nr:uncharacterized protein LOC126749458 [Anthonomus grandis grandis]
MPDQYSQSEEEARAEFLTTFCDVAAFQGRVAYCLMSVYAVNPYVFEYFTDINFYPYFFWNMVYGITFMIVSRPSMRPLMPIHRATFSLLGSLSFNYSSLMWYDWLNVHLGERTILRTLAAYFSGRVFMVHLIAFMYHVDTRCTAVDQRPRRESVFEAMYL